MKYADQEKKRIIEEATSADHGGLGRVCEKYGISRQTLSNWKAKFGNGKHTGAESETDHEKAGVRAIFLDNRSEDLLGHFEDRVMSRLSKLLAGPLADNIAVKVIERLRNA